MPLIAERAERAAAAQQARGVDRARDAAASASRKGA